MNIHKIYPGDTGASALALLNKGELPMPLAPCIELANGKYCIPQHYLQYEQTVETVSSILNDIGPINDILLFCGHDEFGLYLQVGSVGPDNYKHSRQRRLVYGRKWRIETYTPTSEVIQTAFMAIKKACEHEVRELLSIKDEMSGRSGTPFSTHVDLPLMAQFPELVQRDAAATEPDIERWLQGVLFDGRKIRVMDAIVRNNGNIIVDLAFTAPDQSRSRAGFDQLPFSIVLLDVSEAVLLHEIMNALIRHSDRLIDEQFLYRGFARFSQGVSPRQTARLSIATRAIALPDEQFERLRNQLNYDTDTRRAPSLGVGALADRNRSALAREIALEGHMPLEITPRQEFFSAHEQLTFA